MVKRTPAQWQALFAQHHRSGLSAAAFCRQHKLCPKYFSLRKKQLRWTPTAEVDGKPAKSAFIPARVPPCSSPPIRLRWQSLELSVPDGVSPQWVAHLMTELAS